MRRCVMLWIPWQVGAWAGSPKATCSQRTEPWGGGMDAWPPRPNTSSSSCSSPCTHVGFPINVLSDVTQQLLITSSVAPNMIPHFLPIYAS